jgi:hypothetical protein
LAEEKYRHFKKLYGGADCKIDILVSSRDRREDERYIGIFLIRTILKTIGERKINEEKVKDIFVVVPKRGVMLKLKAEEIKIN